MSLLENPKLVKFKHKGETIHFLAFWENDLKKPRFKYFIQGQGHFSTAKFEVLDTVMPARWDESLTWLDVARLYDQYGRHVAYTYAECKTAGIVAPQTANGYWLTYKAINDLIDDTITPEFFELLVCDYQLSCFGMYTFDIVTFDKLLAKKDSEYDDVLCTYKGNEISVQEYVLTKYGQRAVDIVHRLNDKAVLNS